MNNYTILTAIITSVLTSFIIIARTKRYADCFPLFDCLPVPTNLKSRNIEIIRRAEIAISTRGHLPARFFSPPKVIFPAQGAARGFAQQTQGRSRGLEKLPRAVKKTKGSAQGLNVAFHTWCLENVVFVGVDIPKILLAAGQREEIDEQLPSG